LFLLIPLLFTFGAVVGIAIIIWKKRFYLNKLYVLNSEIDAESFDSTFNWKSYLGEFFPEIKSRLDNFKFYEYRSLLLMEIEKSLRRTRLVFMKVDRWSDSLIKRIRRVHTNGKLNGNGVASQQIITEIASDKTETASTPPVSISQNFLKNEEEHLIIKIAQNPKDPNLYETLGDLYVEMNNFTDAKESYEAAIELSPQNETLKQKLSSALEKKSLQK